MIADDPCPLATTQLLGLGPPGFDCPISATDPPAPITCPASSQPCAPPNSETSFPNLSYTRLPDWLATSRWAPSGAQEKSGYCPIGSRATTPVPAGVGRNDPVPVGTPPGAPPPAWIPTRPAVATTATRIAATATATVARRRRRRIDHGP